MRGVLVLALSCAVAVGCGVHAPDPDPFGNHTASSNADTSAGSDSAGTTTTTTSAGEITGADTSAASTASTGEAEGSETSAGSTTAAADSTDGGSTTAVSGSDGSTTAAGESSSSEGGDSSEGGMMNCPAAPTNLAGCPACGAQCDSPWTISWDAVPGATEYLIEYTCFIFPGEYMTANTSADLCTEVGMCTDNNCANGAGPVTVSACNANCCSSPAQVPVDETPIACGGGVCC